jgi:hypothetical protein
VTTYERLDGIASALERRLGTWLAAGCVGLVGLALACVVVRIDTRPRELGKFYAWLSQDPASLGLGNPVGFRPLTPLFSYAIGLRGPNLMYTNLALAALLLACVYAWFRRRAPRPGDALLAAAALAFSLVTLSTVFSPHYCDSATYLAAFGMWCLRRRPLPFYALFAVALFNRESLVFLAPWFAFMELAESQSRLRTLATQAAGYGLALIPVLAYRSWVATLGPTEFGLDYYLAPLREDPLHFYRESLRHQGAGLYSVFGAAWVIVVAAAVSMWRRGQRQGVAALALLLAVTGSQLLLASDVSRLLTLGFLAMVVAFEELCARDALAFRSWAPWLILLQALEPHIRVAGNRAWIMDSLWGSLFRAH